MARPIGVIDLVASDADDCAARASKVFADRHRFADVTEPTKAAAPRLFDDHRSIIAMNERLQKLVKEARDHYG